MDGSRKHHNDLGTQKQKDKYVYSYIRDLRHDEKSLQFTIPEKLDKK